MATPIKKGVEYNCPMFEVRCKQPGVSNGVRVTRNCPYDNYNSNQKIPKGYQGHYARNSNGGNTLIMVTNETTTSKKGAKQMAGKKNTGGNDTAMNSGGKPFQPTFRKYTSMNEGEQAAFRQGAKTSENKVKERLGFTKPKGN